MYALIAILAPSIFGVKIIDYFNKGLSLKNTIYYFIILLMFSSVINTAISYLLLNTDMYIFNSINNYPLLFSKYTLISIIINVILAIIIVIAQKNISFNIEVESASDGKDTSKTKKSIKKNKNK